MTWIESFSFMICSSWILHNYNALSWLTRSVLMTLTYVNCPFTIQEIWIPLLFTNHVNKTKTNSERRGRYINWHFDQLMALQFKEKEYCQTSFCNHLLQVQMTSPQRPVFQSTKIVQVKLPYLKRLVSNHFLQSTGTTLRA